MKFLIFFFLCKIAIFADIKTYDLSEATESLSKEFHTYKIQDLLKQKYIALDSDLEKDYLAQNININDNLSQSEKNILEDTFYVQFAMVTAIGVLYIMPESVTNWDGDTFGEESLTDKWKDNIKAGPVLDEDSVTINYIGHPVSGAVYYAMARNDGLDPLGSFLFATLMSSFFWECGYEAFAEIPSIQDLVSTPVVGALMGEYMHYLEQQLDKSGGKIWGYQSLGSFSYFLLDPMGNAAQGISDFLDLSVTMKFNTYQEAAYQSQDMYNISLNKPTQFSSYNYGFELNFEF